ncbi:hypothetical protein CFP65_1637 [Kitasatospora sp. MMS16-BH015]|uniref:hypothetical protein n=1 Tax=Kitasatospora sp. MMS16-BH015 TaxID=2018025 RepID=UPI000CA09F72|nr:hypothetical protein [Kitasatospora sp. MMS16-BH015]AUG76523.1 hypothetical protein CFP65_1637 [Kitasatospora sp. MMS16-BH015]
MTVPGAKTPQLGRALHAARPAARLWALVLVGLLALLPCAGRAQAVTAGPAAEQAAQTAQAAPVTRTAQAAPTTQVAKSAPRHQLKAGHLASLLADAGLLTGHGVPQTLCVAGDQPPHPGDGCSNHPFCGSESQLPNAPPQADAPVPALLVPAAVPACPALGASKPGAVPAPDLHELQVHRI